MEGQGLDRGQNCKLSIGVAGLEFWVAARKKQMVPWDGVSSG